MPHRLSIALLCALFATTVAQPQPAPTSLPERTKRAEAQLSERLANTLRKTALDLRVNSSTSVRELIESEPKIAVALDAYLQGVIKTASTSTADAPRLTAKVVIDIPTLAATLKPLAAKYSKGTRVRNADFDTMPQLNGKNALTVKAAAWVPSKFADLPAYKIDPATGKADYRLPPLWMKHLTPRLIKPARALTRLAARRDGIERLARRLADADLQNDPKATPLTPKMLFGKDDNAQTILKSFLQDTTITGIRYHRDILVCEVEVRASLKNAVTSLKAWVEMHGSPEAREHIPALIAFVQNSRRKTIESVGIAAVAPRYVRPEYDSVQTAMVNLVAATPDWAFTTITRVDSTQGTARAALSEAIKGLPMLGRNNEGPNTLNDFLKTNVASAPNMQRDFDELTASFPTENTAPEAADQMQVAATANLKDVWNFVLHYAPQIAEAKVQAAADTAAAQAAAEAKAKVEASRPDAITPEQPTTPAKPTPPNPRAQPTTPEQQPAPEEKSQPATPALPDPVVTQPTQPATPTQPSAPAPTTPTQPEQPEAKSDTPPAVVGPVEIQPVPAE